MQKKLTLAFISFALIPLFLVLQWSLVYVHRDQIFNQAGDTARLIKTQLAQQVREKTRDLQSFSLNEIFWEHSLESPQNVRKDLQNYSNALLATHPEYKLVLMVDTKGVVQVANTKDAKGEPLKTENLIGKSFERSTWFQKALTTSEAFIETPKELDFLKTIYGLENLQVVPVAKAIRNQKGEITGVWAIFSNADFLNEVLKSSAGSVVEPGIFGIYDSAGNVLAEHNTLNGKEMGGYETATELISFEGHDWSIKSHLQEQSLIDYLRIYFWPVLAVLGLIILYALVAARRFTIPLQRLIRSTELLVKGNFSFGVPYQQRADEYGNLARALMDLQKIRNTKGAVNSAQENKVQATSQKIEDTVQLITGLSAQANMLALNASMEAVKAHHLDEIAEKANELAQRTSYNSQELLKKLNEIKAVCDDIQNPQAENSSTVKSS
jgi:HAMP domain-containing protein